MRPYICVDVITSLLKASKTRSLTCRNIASIPLTSHPSYEPFSREIKRTHNKIFLTIRQVLFVVVLYEEGSCQCRTQARLGNKVQDRVPKHGFDPSQRQVLGAMF